MNRIWFNFVTQYRQFRWRRLICFLSFQHFALSKYTKQIEKSLLVILAAFFPHRLWGILRWTNFFFLASLINHFHISAKGIKNHNESVYLFIIQTPSRLSVFTFFRANESVHLVSTWSVNKLLTKSSMKSLYTLSICNVFIQYFDDKCW